MSLFDAFRYDGKRVLVAGGATGMWVIRQVNPPGEAGDPLTFVVSDDDTLVTAR